MAQGKENEFLDASESEDDQINGYDSEDELRKGGRNTKRRKIDDSLEDAGEANKPEPDDFDASSHSEVNDEETLGLDGGAIEEKSKAGAKRSKTAASELPDVSRPLRRNLVTSEKAVKKSGVVYLSRVPPFMKPTKLRSLLEPYGVINRIFLAPEDPTAHTRRVRAGGNKKRSYTEGWVEFVKKDDAKTACELLNSNTIGGKKGSYYHDDIWNLLYLRGFKWHNLTEQIAAENAERTSRMRAEISKTTKENKDFVKNVERAKMLDGMQAKTKMRKVAATGGGEEEEVATTRTRTFKQIPQAIKPQDMDEQPEHVTRVLSKIF